MNTLTQAADPKPLSTFPKNRYIDISELMKPRQLSDLTLPKFIIDDLKRRIATNSIENMLFYGKPGTGKSSAANLIMSELTEWNQRSFDGRNGIGPVTFQEKIVSYARNSFISNSRRICFIDNVDHISKDVRKALYRLIWDTRDACRFILAANSHPSDLISEELLRTVWFNVRPPRDEYVQVHVFHQYERELSEAEIQFDRTTLIEIVSCYFPNLHDIANGVQNEFIGPDPRSVSSPSSFRSLLRLGEE
jgi:replication-associated recombination protein RarA